MSESTAILPYKHLICEPMVVVVEDIGANGAAIASIVIGDYGKPFAGSDTIDALLCLRESARKLMSDVDDAIMVAVEGVR